MKEGVISGIKNRVFQHLARFLPGATSLRVLLHRWRGVKIGNDVWIGYDTVIETSSPKKVFIGNNVGIGMRSTIIAHFREMAKSDKENEKDFISVRIEDRATIGPGVLILPNVTIGEGSVVMAGSVVSKSVAPMTMVRGNPAKPVAKCGIPLTLRTSIKEFMKNLKPIK